MDTEQLASIRSFNRHLTQRIGALNDSFLGRGRPLGEARLLYEIGRAGAEVRTLRLRLDLDSGYLSRLLRSLDRQRLIAAVPTQADARRRTITLTAKGMRELGEYDKRSDRFAKSILQPLDEDQREKLVAAMANVDRLLRVSAVRLDLEPAGSPDARWCLAQYFAELERRFDQGFDEARGLSATAEELTPPAGLFIVARSMGMPVGCGALKVMERKVGLIKRMWVHESVRGFKLGARLLRRLEDEARALGLTMMRLDTNRALKEAQALYRRSGYREVCAFNDEFYAHHWFEKRLSKRPTRPRQPHPMPER
jgi:DNA-binding MarR family transcriptional regulator/GNAT superfamily N-acetyltransferase